MDHFNHPNQLMKVSELVQNQISYHALKPFVHNNLICSLSEASVKMFDGAAMEHMKRPSCCKTFDEYADKGIIPYVMHQLHTVERIDIEWDSYLMKSIKEQTRQGRGIGIRKCMEGKIVLPKDWNIFLRINENKEEFYAFLSRKLTNLSCDNKNVYTTLHQHVLTKDRYLSVQGLNPCNHEEADARMFLHAAHVARNGHNRLLMRTSDTDVFFLALALFEHQSLNELWLAFGTG